LTNGFQVPGIARMWIFHIVYLENIPFTILCNQAVSTWNTPLTEKRLSGMVLGKLLRGGILSTKPNHSPLSWFCGPW